MTTHTTSHPHTHKTLHPAVPHPEPTDKPGTVPLADLIPGVGNPLPQQILDALQKATDSKAALVVASADAATKQAGLTNFQTALAASLELQTQAKATVAADLDALIVLIRQEYQT